MDEPVYPWILTPLDREWLRRRQIDPGPNETVSATRLNQWRAHIQFTESRRKFIEHHNTRENSDGA